jgi:hypothetical protein
VYPCAGSLPDTTAPVFCCQKMPNQMRGRPYPQSLEAGKDTSLNMGLKNVVWALLALVLQAVGNIEASNSSRIVCLSDSEFAFVQRLSRYDLYEIGELVGLYLPDPEGSMSSPAEWGAFVIDRVRCLSPDGMLLVQEALLELGHSWTEPQLDEAEFLAQANVDMDLDVARKSTEDEKHKLMREERLIAPASCWNPTRGPQVFFADPPVHLDPADPTRQIEQEAGKLSTWDFKSEEMRLRAGVCFPPGSKLARPRGCTIALQKGNALPHEKSGQVICSAPFGEESNASYDVDAETRVLTHAYNADTKSEFLDQGGVIVTLCTPLAFYDNAPGQWRISLSLTCEHLDHVYKHHAEMNVEVYWQRQAWTEHAVAWGTGLHQARAGEEASFYVQMVSREGRNMTSGGDHLQGQLSGPALLSCSVTDLSNGTYSFKYVPWDAGVYSLEVLVTFLKDVALLDLPGSHQLEPRDVVYAHIRGSPFTVEIAPFQDRAAGAARGGAEPTADLGGGLFGGGPVGPFPADSNRSWPLCSAEQALSGRGRWVFRDSNLQTLCNKRHVHATHSQRPLQRACALDEVGVEHRDGEVSQYMWLMTNCSALLYSASDLLACAHRRTSAERTRRSSSKILILGSSMQRTLFYDLVLTFRAHQLPGDDELVRMSRIDLSDKHANMRFTVCFRSNLRGTLMDDEREEDSTNCYSHNSSNSCNNRRLWLVVSVERGHGGQSTRGQATCIEESAGRILDGQGALQELEIVFEWAVPDARRRAQRQLERSHSSALSPDFLESSMDEYTEFAEQIRKAAEREGVSGGDVLLVGSHPYDMFQRPIATVREGAKLVASVLAELGSHADARDAPLVLFRNADAIHLPWLWDNPMYGVMNGISSARGLYVHSIYEEAMRERRVKVLDALPVTQARADKTHDGLHYFHRKAGGMALRQGMALYSNEVGHVILQLMFNAICNHHIQI